jgi:hypothetical protein
MELAFSQYNCPAFILLNPVGGTCVGTLDQFVEGIKATKEMDKYCNNNFPITASEF